METSFPASAVVRGDPQPPSRELPAAQTYVARLEKQHGKAKAISILAARLARTAWLMLKRKEAFDATKFLK